MLADLKIKPGFKDPVLNSQMVFRCLLNAMSEPGIIVPATFSSLFEEYPPAGAALLSIALTLCDFQTSFWLSPSLEEIEPYLTFHTGAKSTAKEDADFILASSSQELPTLSSLKLGSETRPDNSATVILNLTGKGGSSFQATGPGIDGAISIKDIGLTAELVSERNKLLPLFPQGIDFFLCLDEAVMALPRTSKLSEI
jgi:alpha-D-ribose 1-methylphosphonate 5-triphosphate synthase subunit PhnH